MGNKVTCTCGHSWNKSDSSKKDATVCHICGKDNEMKNGGWLDKYEQGGMVLKQKTNDNYGKKDNPNDVKVSVGDDYVGLAYDTTGRNYSPAWGGQFAMGGTIPGSVGFTYARTGDTPSEGPYAKKTLPSAQNGQEMQYYQEGLDWKPKNISRNGGWLDAYDVPDAQDGRTIKAANAEFSCEAFPRGKENSTSVTPGNVTGFSNAPVTWNELIRYNETNPKDKVFKNRLKELQSQFPGLTSDQLLAAQGDSARIKQRMSNLPRYDQPAEQTYDKAYHQFYRTMMNQLTPVTTPQILQFQSQQPEGLPGYKKVVESNYGRAKLKEGGELPKAQNGKTKPPIFTDDPRKVQNYRDSSVIANEVWKLFADDGTDDNTQGNVRLTKGKPKYSLDKLNESAIRLAKNTGKYPQFFGDNYYEPRLGRYIYGYKKPVQPYILKQKPQTGKQLPTIFTDNPNNPRIKAYQDSLSLYNKGELNYQNRLKFNKENNIPIKSTRTWDDPVEFDKFLNYSKIQPIQGNGYWYNHSADVVADTNISSKLTDNYGFRYKKPIQPVVYKKPDPTLKPRNRVDQEFIEITPGTPQLAQGPNVQVQQRPIQNLPYQVDWRMGNEDRTNYFVNEEEGAAFLKELNPVTGLPEYRNRGDYNASGRYTAADKLRGLEQGGIIQDDMGQWAHPGEITQINSPYITMEGVPYPVLGIADTGEEQMMYPGQDYEFEGAEYVTEYPKGKRPKKAKNGVNQADENSLVQLDQLTNFTNYNTKQPGGWLDNL